MCRGFKRYAIFLTKSFFYMMRPNEAFLFTLPIGLQQEIPHNELSRRVYVWLVLLSVLTFIQYFILRVINTEHLHLWFVWHIEVGVKSSAQTLITFFNVSDECCILKFKQNVVECFTNILKPMYWYLLITVYDLCIQKNVKEVF